VPDIKAEIDNQVTTNERLLQELDGRSLGFESSAADGANSHPVDLEERILAVARESVEQVAMIQLFHGNVRTPLDNMLDKQKKGWLTIYDQNLSTMLGKLPPSSVIGVILDSPMGKNFVFSFMAELSVPLYLISTSMGKVQLEEMVASRVLTHSISLYLKGKIEKSMHIDETDGLDFPIGKCAVFLFLESGQLSNKELNPGMVDEFKRRFTPRNGYLFIVVEKRFFHGYQGESTLSYISETSLNNIRFFEEQNGRFLELSGFYSMKTYQLKLIDDFSVRTKVVGRDIIV
jgi:hypothetical protein